MKKSVKILIIILSMVIVGLITYIVVDKTIISKKNKSNATNDKGNSTMTTNDIEKQAETTKKRHANMIWSEIEKKDFLAKNEIKEDDIVIFKFCTIEGEVEPIYLVLISYLEEGEPQHAIVFQFTYADGKVSYDKIEDHKYLSDTVSYDSNKKILRLSATYHGGTRNNYFTLKDGKFEAVDLAVQDDNREYDFKEIVLREYNEVEKLDTNETKIEASYIKINGMYECKSETENYYHEASVELSNQTDSSVTFEINAAHGKNIDSVNIGEITGIAKKIEIPEDCIIPESTQYAYEFVEDSNGTKSKITIVYTAHRSFEYVTVKEEYTDGINPYAGNNVYFAGEYEKVNN